MTAGHHVPLRQKVSGKIMSGIAPALQLVCATLALGSFAIGLAQADDAGAAPQDIRLLGYLEMVSLPEGGIAMKAKLDTGADNSSIHAPDREFFEKDGDEWIRFSVEGSDGREATFERKIVRIAKIEHRTGPNAKRPVVMMSLCLGDKEEIVEVNLADRSGLTYPMLVGRSFLERGILINSAAKWTTDPNCSKDPGQ